MERGTRSNSRLVETKMTSDVDRSRPCKRSFVLPAYNEAGYIATMIDRTVAAGELRSDPFEVIVIDNASTDDTASIVDQIARRDHRVRLIRHSENRLYAASCLTGAKESSGDRVFILDSDGQHDPVDIWKFDSQLDQGYDFVFGWRTKRAEPIPRLVMSKFLWLMARVVVGFHLHDVNCGVRGFTRAFADELEIRHKVNFVNPEFFVRARQGGFRIGEAQVVQDARKSGTSSHEFSFRRLVGIFVAVTRYLLQLRFEQPRVRQA